MESAGATTTSPQPMVEVDTGAGGSAGATMTSPQPMVAVDAGAGESADAGDPQDPIVPPAHCDVDGGCVSQCTNQSATCAVISSGVICELDGFVGASAEVGCGQRTIVGTACCGGCGCVPVEVFFDGTSCWQGVPTCAFSGLADQLFNPHDAGAADGGWISAENNGVQGQFYLGTTDLDAGDSPSGDSGADGGTASLGGNNTTIDANGSDGTLAGADTDATAIGVSGSDSGPAGADTDATAIGVGGSDSGPAGADTDAATGDAGSSEGGSTGP